MPEIILVGQRPAAVKLGTVLTDGTDHYKVIDRHSKAGEQWFYLENITSPELEARSWFRLEDMYELAFDRVPGGRRKKHGVAKGPSKPYRRRQ